MFVLAHGSLPLGLQPGVVDLVCCASVHPRSRPTLNTMVASALSTRRTALRKRCWGQLGATHCGPVRLLQPVMCMRDSYTAASPVEQLASFNAWSPVSASCALDSVGTMQVTSAASASPE